MQMGWFICGIIPYRMKALLNEIQHETSDVKKDPAECRVQDYARHFSGGPNSGVEGGEQECEI